VFALTLCPSPPQYSPTYELYPDGTIRAVGYNLCLNSQGPNPASGNLVQLYGCTGTSNEIFFVSPNFVQGEIQFDGDTSLCLDAQTGNLQSGNLVQLYPCTGAPNQIWQFYPDFTIRIASKPSLCLNVQTSVQLGNKLQIYTCQSGQITSNEQFLYTSWGWIQSFNTNYCLDAPGAPTTYGVPLVLYQCGSSSPQTFDLNPVDATTGSIRPTASPYMCFNIQWGVYPSELLQLYGCNGQANEIFQFQSDSTIRVVSNTALCFDVQGGSIQAGANIMTNGCDSGAPSQKWLKSSDGTIRSTTNTNLCMSTTSGALATGTVIQLQSCSQNLVGYNQIWFISPVQN